MFTVKLFLKLYLTINRHSVQMRRGIPMPPLSPTAVSSAPYPTPSSSIQTTPSLQLLGRIMSTSSSGAIAAPVRQQTLPLAPHLQIVCGVSIYHDTISCRVMTRSSLARTILTMEWKDGPSTAHNLHRIYLDAQCVSVSSSTSRTISIVLNRITIK